MRAYQTQRILLYGLLVPFSIITFAVFLLPFVLKDDHRLMQRNFVREVSKNIIADALAPVLSLVTCAAILVWVVIHASVKRTDNWRSISKEVAALCLFTFIWLLVMAVETIGFRKLERPRNLSHVRMAVGWLLAIALAIPLLWESIYARIHYRGKWHMDLRTLEENSVVLPAP